MICDMNCLKLQTLSDIIQVGQIKPYTGGTNQALYRWDKSSLFGSWSTLSLLDIVAHFHIVVRCWLIIYYKTPLLFKYLLYIFFVVRFFCRNFGTHGSNIPLPPYKIRGTGAWSKFGLWCCYIGRVSIMTLKRLWWNSPSFAGVIMTFHYVSGRNWELTFLS